jgi:hypothetical protein
MEGVEHEVYRNYEMAHQSQYGIPLAHTSIASQSPLSSVGDETRHLSIALQANMGAHHNSLHRTTELIKDGQGWINVTYGDVSTPMPRQLQLPPYPSTVPSVIPTIIHALSDFRPPATQSETLQSERMEEDYDGFGSPRQVRSN